MSEHTTKVTAYSYMCDRCGKGTPAKLSRTEAAAEVESAGWYANKFKDEHYCPDCLREYHQMARAAGIDLEVPSASRK